MDTVTMNFVVCQWIRLRLPFCSPGFESQANHYLPTPFQFVVELLWCEKNENKNKKRPGLAQFFWNKNVSFSGTWCTDKRSTSAQSWTKNFGLSGLSRTTNVNNVGCRFLASRRPTRRTTPTRRKIETSPFRIGLSGVKRHFWDVLFCWSCHFPAQILLVPTSCQKNCLRFSGFYVPHKLPIVNDAVRDLWLRL